jgi:hypothetical protein
VTAVGIGNNKYICLLRLQCSKGIILEPVDNCHIRIVNIAICDECLQCLSLIMVWETVLSVFTNLGIPPAVIEYGNCRNVLSVNVASSKEFFVNAFRNVSRIGEVVW